LIEKSSSEILMAKHLGYKEETELDLIIINQAFSGIRRYF